MKKFARNRDAIKSFLESVLPPERTLQHGALHCGLPARERPRLSLKTKSGEARRSAAQVG